MAGLSLLVHEVRQHLIIAAEKRSIRKELAMGQWRAETATSEKADSQSQSRGGEPAVAYIP